MGKGKDCTPDGGRRSKDQRLTEMPPTSILGGNEEAGTCSLNLCSEERALNPKQCTHIGRSLSPWSDAEKRGKKKCALAASVFVFTLRASPFMSVALGSPECPRGGPPCATTTLSNIIRPGEPCMH
eukprot:scaffold10200_cov122-Isochrysis_galbana.AAC.5